MEIVAILVPFVLLGIAVVFVAFSGGPGRAREVYLTRGGRGFRVLIPMLYVALGLGVPALVIAGRDQAKGGTARLANDSLSAKEAEGKRLFQQACST